MLLLESSPVTSGPAASPADVSGPMLPVVILGGGLSGLSAAWHLRQQGIPVVVFEAGVAPGGVMNSVREGGWLWETGPNTLFESSPEIRAFITRLGLGDRR